MNVPVKLRLAPLTALVVGSMVGGGIFSIPQNIAASAAPAATLLAQGLFTPRKGPRSHARG